MAPQSCFVHLLSGSNVRIVGARWAQTSPPQKKSGRTQQELESSDCLTSISDSESRVAGASNVNDLPVQWDGGLSAQIIKLPNRSHALRIMI